MGLDMYLLKKTYIGNNFKKLEEQVKIEIDGVQQKRVSQIVEDVGYWRKANQIHSWFVKNVQNGNDNCGEYYVSEDKIKELLSLTNKVLNDHTKAESLLPAQEGFFFGSIEYDKYYFQDLLNTKEILEAVLSDKNGEFYYHSSW